MQARSEEVEELGTSPGRKAEGATLSMCLFWSDWRVVLPAGRMQMLCRRSADESERKCKSATLNPIELGDSIAV